MGDPYTRISKVPSNIHVKFLVDTSNGLRPFAEQTVIHFYILYDLLRRISSSYSHHGAACYQTTVSVTVSYRKFLQNRRKISVTQGRRDK